MSYNISTTILPAGISYYVYPDSTNPTVIETGGSAVLKFYADGIYYTLQKAASSVSVTGADANWVCTKPFTEGVLTLSNPTANVTVSVTAKAGVSPQVVASPFKYSGKAPIDIRLVLSKRQMLNTVDTGQPEKYFAICTDDGKLYVYDKSVTPNGVTGKFQLYEAPVDEDDLATKLPGAIIASMTEPTTKESMEASIGTTLPGAIAKAMETEGVAEEIAEAMFNSEHFSTTVDKKIDLSINLIQAVDGNS